MLVARRVYLHFTLLDALTSILTQPNFIRDAETIWLSRRMA